VSTMLKSNQIESPNYDHNPESSHAMLGIVPNELSARGAVSSSEQATIGKGLVLHGEITGSESLFIDGKVEGSINLPGSRVTVGLNGIVEATISAREIVVMGKIRGNVSATDRVDIRAEGGLTGDVTAARVSIEDGAFFKGGIDIRKVEPKQVHSIQPTLATVSVLKEA
jgi:cytoskeletal protein CcmA (bactofilin family)